MYSAIYLAVILLRKTINKIFFNSDNFLSTILGFRMMFICGTSVMWITETKNIHVIAYGK